MSEITVDTKRIFYTEKGSGPALVLVHGFPLDHRVWEAQLEALSANCRVIALDLPGFGRSKCSEPFSMSSQADDLHTMLEKIGALPCMLGGLSMGGYVALAYVRKYPSDLNGLILVDTRSEADTPEGKAGRMKMIESVRTGGSKAVADAMMPKMLSPESATSRPHLVQKLRTIMEDCPPLTIEHALLAMRDRPDLREELASIAVPTLIIVGDHDVITPPEMSQYMQRQISHSTLAVVKGAGHMAIMEQPEQVNSALRKFRAGTHGS
jgi:pimeloyl-ACP methyl ester carboxylesterase